MSHDRQDNPSNPPSNEVSSVLGDPGKLADLLRLEHLYAATQDASATYRASLDAATQDASAAYQSSLDAATQDAGSAGRMRAPASPPTPPIPEVGSEGQGPRSTAPEPTNQPGTPGNPFGIDGDPLAWAAWEVAEKARRLEADNRRLHAACARLDHALAWIAWQARNTAPSPEVLRLICNAALRARSHFSGAPRPAPAGEVQGPQTTNPEPGPMCAAADSAPASTDPKPEAVGRCSTCKRWRLSATSPHTDPVPGLGACMKIIHTSDVAGRQDDAERKTLKPKFAHLKAFAADLDGYSAHLLTLPDFGCSMHEPKP